MIGKIVVLLLAVVSFNCILMEAQMTDCLFYRLPGIDFANITGFAYVEEHWMRLDVPCYSLTIKPGPPFAVGNIYNATYTYNDGGQLKYIRYTLYETLIPGEAESIPEHGLGLVENEIWVIVAYVGDSSGFQGYALVSCGYAVPIHVTIFLKNKPPQSAVVSQLKAQLPPSIQDMQLYVVPHNDTCVYPQH